MNYEDRVLADARLCMLKELADQVDGRLHDKALMYTLDAFAMRRDIDWVRTQLLALKDLGAVKVSEMGSVMIATLTSLGRKHVERRAVIVGVARPSDPD